MFVGKVEFRSLRTEFLILTYLLEFNETSTLEKKHKSTGFSSKILQFYRKRLLVAQPLALNLVKSTMLIFNTIDKIRDHLKHTTQAGKTVALVPTMGALHNGHMRLVKEAVKQADHVVASIFVNPTQFNNAADLEKCPRTVDADLKLLESHGCHAVFAPSEQEVYPEKPSISIRFGSLESELEGKFRPGHFSGVGLVVSKLLNIVNPDFAFFGQKDLQQFFVIKALVEQLNFKTQLRMVPIERETSGLAMSSRNMRLSEADRAEASLIHKALTQSKNRLLRGDSVQSVKNQVTELFKSSDRFTLEYFEVIDTSDFKLLESINYKENTALCIAAEIGQVRLIDNLMLIS